MKADGQYAAEDGREEFKEQRDTGEVAGADLLTHGVALGKLLDLSVPPLIPCKAAKRFCDPSRFNYFFNSMNK